MDESQIRVLLVEDDPADARLIEITLLKSERTKFDLTHVTRLGDALSRLTEDDYDVVLLDLGLPDSWGPDTFIETHKKSSEVPAVILTGLDIQSFAIEAMQLGAQDYLIKGHIDTHVLECSIRYAIERKHLEYETIAAREAALEAKRTTSEFLANMSHEIRTPLNAMIGAASLLLDSELTDGQQEWMSMVHTSGETLLSLINDILDLSRIEAGKLTIEPMPFNLESVVQEVSDLVSARLEQTNVNLEVRYPPDVPRQLIGDPGRIRQVLTNLASNAIKFTHEGHVIISIESDEQTDDEVSLRLAVEDTGIGIPQDQLDQIFEKFIQARNSGAQRYGGTGLGLAICHQLVDLMGGTIGATSREGEGSTFRFRLRLPISAQEQPSAQSPSSSGKAGKATAAEPINARVLVVEDNVFNQRVAVEMLKRFSCRVDVAANGREAVDMVQTFPFDLVFMDCQMPEMDGYEATAEIRRRETSTQHVPIIAMTAQAMQGDRERCIEAGMDDYVSKPVRMENLETILTQYLSQPAGEELYPAIDPAIFNSLWEILGDDAPGLTRTYMRETEALLEEMKQAFDRFDWDGVERSAHTMKGSSATIGARVLVETCQQLQTIAMTEDADQVSKKLYELESRFDAVKGELTKLLI